jgi:hypothetical protein
MGKLDFPSLFESMGREFERSNALIDILISNGLSFRSNASSSTLKGDCRSLSRIRAAEISRVCMLSHSRKARFVALPFCVAALERAIAAWIQEHDRS